jgi:hypothetical protein
MKTVESAEKERRRKRETGDENGYRPTKSQTDRQTEKNYFSQNFESSTRVCVTV